jgi:hypothetical protein
LIATFLLDVVVFIDTVWIGDVVRATWTITLTKLVVAWTSIWTVCMARAVIAAFVEVRIVTFVLAECVTMTCGNAFIADCLAIVDTFRRLVTPNSATFFNWAGLIWISTPVRTWTSVGTFGVAWTFVDTIDVICAANGFAVWVTITSGPACVRQVGTLVTTLLGNVNVTVLIETVLIGVWNVWWTVTVSKVV